MTPAALQRRVAAFLIDQIMLFAVVIGIGLAAGVRRGEADDGAVLAISLLGVVVAVAYHAIGVARFGRTLGKHLLGLRVVSTPQGAPVTMSYAALRALVPSAAVLLPVIGNFAGLAVYLWAVFDPARQGLHDKLAGTMVVPAVVESPA
jgi:uncharacterized RDD family membrane protein YckC